MRFVGIFNDEILQSCMQATVGDLLNTRRCDNMLRSPNSLGLELFSNPCYT